LYTHAHKIEKLLDVLLAQVGQEKKFVQTLLEYGKMHATFGADGKYAKVFELKNFIRNVCGIFSIPFKVTL